MCLGFHVPYGRDALCILSLNCEKYMEHTNLVYSLGWATRKHLGSKSPSTGVRQPAPSPPVSGGIPSYVSPVRPTAASCSWTLPRRRGGALSGVNFDGLHIWNLVKMHAGVLCTRQAFLLQWLIRC